MKRTCLSLIIGAAALCACNKVPAAYRIDPPPAVPALAEAIRVLPFEDARSDTDRKGTVRYLGHKSTRDSLYSDSVSEAITLALTDELMAVGVNSNGGPGAGYTVSGKVLGYRALLIPPRTNFIPYVKYVTWLWTKDRFSVDIRLQIELDGPGGKMFTKSYDLSSDSAAWVGLMGLTSTARGWDRPGLAKLLRAGLKELLSEAAADVAAVLRKEE